MHLVPIIPQPKVGVEESLEVSGVAAVKPAKPVMERTLPPLVSHIHEHHEQVSFNDTRPGERKIARHGDRRRVCRRLQRHTILEELRSSLERRRHQQRKSDMQMHIDEKV